MSEYPQAPPPEQPVPTSSATGFFGALFDFDFEHYATPIIVKVVYVIVMIALVLSWLAWVIFAFGENGGLGVFVLLVGALITIIYLSFARMTLEIIVAVIRMSQDIHTRLPGA